MVLVANCWSQSGHFLTRDGMLNTGLSFFALDSFVELEFSSGMFTCKGRSIYIIELRSIYIIELLINCCFIFVWQ